LTPRDLAFADTAGKMRTRKGKYGLWVGGGQQRTGAPGAAATLNLTSGTALPD
jgi:hypothetical protein